MSDGWSLVYEDYDPAQEGLRETLCTLGNGYLCTRGAAPDSHADDTHYPATYLAGGYDRLKTEIAGHVIESEDLVNIPNWLVLKVRIGEGPWLDPDTVEILDYRQELDVASGILHRTLRFRDPEGRTTRWEERRFVSMADAHLAGLEVTLTAEDWSGRLSVHSALDGSVINDGVPRYRALARAHLKPIDTGQSAEDTIWLMCRTVQSRVEIAQAARTRVFAGDTLLAPERTLDCRPDLVAQDIPVDLEAGGSVRVEKVVSVVCSRDRAVSEPSLATRERIAEVGTFQELVTTHVVAWKHIWEEFDLRLDISDGDHSQLKLRIDIFHLMQTVSRHTIHRDVGVPPRGWHGEAYRAHIMWDELFIFPFINLRYPILTRSLLLYRYRRLPAARRLARDAGHRGAMYPWQSGSSGREESQTLHLNPQSGRWIPDTSNRQRHVSCAVAYNVWQYFEVSNDHDFLYDYGAEMLAEIARFWASVAHYDEGRGRYDICGVMGPDEFHTAYPGKNPAEEGGLRNNAYTNVFVAWVMNRARDALDLLPPDRERRLREQLGLTQAEVDEWDEISRRLCIPFHDEGIISQFEGYGDLVEFDWEGYRRKYGDIQRLDRILEAEGDDPNRYKLSKQADVLMLFYLFSADELQQLFEQLGYPFERDTIPKNIDYYINRTSHGSTLSWIVHSWVLARANRRQSWLLFHGALDSDIVDIQGGTTREGIHLGAMAGTVDLVQRCYTGIEARGGILHFNPALPDHLVRLSARIRYRRQELDIEVTHDTLRIHSRQFTASPVTVAYRGHFRTVSPGAVYEFRLIRPENRVRAGAAAEEEDRRSA